MCSATLLNLGGGEVVLILALILAFVGANKLPEIAKGFWLGITELRKAAREATGKLAEKLNGGVSITRPSHPFLMVLTFILGTMCLILVVYELSK